MAKKMQTVGQLIDKTRKNDVSLGDFLSKDEKEFLPPQFKWLFSKDGLKKWMRYNEVVKSKIQLKFKAENLDQVATIEDVKANLIAEIDNYYISTLMGKFGDNGSVLIPFEHKQTVKNKMVKIDTFHQTTVKQAIEQFMGSKFAKELFEINTVLPENISANDEVLQIENV